MPVTTVIIFVSGNLAGSHPSNPLLQTVGGNVQSCGYETHHGPIRRSIAGFRHLTHVVRKSGKLYGTPLNVFRAP